MEYATKEQIMKTSEIDAELEAVLKQMAVLTPPDYSDVHKFKEMCKVREQELLVALGDPPPSIKQTDHQIATSDNSNIRVRVYQPVDPPVAGSPLIVMYHGGGFTIGRPEAEESSCRNYVEAFGAVCISSSYRLAPEFPFPYAVNDAWDSLRWAAANAKALGADPSLGFVVGGISAGGTISAVLAHMARDEKLSPPLTGQYLSIPALVPHKVVPEKYKSQYHAYEQNKVTPVLPQAAIDMFMGAYKPDDHSVLHAPFNQDHTGVPPAYFQVCGLDPLRDDALIYEKVLREEYGIKTKLDMYPGLPHAFWAYFPQLKSTEKYRAEQVEGMGWLLGQQADTKEIKTDTEGTIA